MAGKETKIIILLVIDITFFFVEIITGYATGSLALVADSFHMLNDVMSLIVALYAVKLSSKSSDHRFSYGWQRAEILGALINGVFLLALCFSIFMEALERFINVTEVSNPKLVVVVGSLGLASNLVGLLLFHDHGHSHGGHSHSHGGHSHGAHSHQHNHAVTNGSSDASRTAASGDETDEEGAMVRVKGAGRRDSVGSLYGHPAQTRAYVVQAAHEMGYDSKATASSSGQGERARLLSGGQADGYGAAEADGHPGHAGHSHDQDVEAGSSKKSKGLFGRKKKSDSHDHEDHDHNAAAASAGHSHGHAHGGHSHGGEGSMNMRGVFLHVLGDALGNVGVIAAGLFIMLSDASWRFYSDPAISFLITIIIFHSALPLVKSASFILLQGVPATVSLDAVRKSIRKVDGVLNLHELHVWQLSESKIVASVHVLVDCSSNQNEKYMEIAAKIRNELHLWGIHSSTIQPEFVPGGLREAARMSGVTVAPDQTDEHGRLITIEGELVEDEVLKKDTACLIACGQDDSCAESACCPPINSGKASRRGSDSGDDHAGHSH
ncbi:cation efflux protein [Violaceomyces palustris]|uniref:Cation efflux protein n=1 Tax=Violaceomyces palustris TaxID=1673888 RepID=A0ACD0NYP7_9BASI|nr:cation efflux protein [Violaceomyces palustris]